MVILEADLGEVQALLSYDDLLIVNQALNEVLNGLWLSEFETRMGHSTGEVSALLDGVRAALVQMRDR